MGNQVDVSPNVVMVLVGLMVAELHPTNIVNTDKVAM